MASLWSIRRCDALEQPVSPLGVLGKPKGDIETGGAVSIETVSPSARHDRDSVTPILGDMISRRVIVSASLDHSVSLSGVWYRRS